MTVLSITCDNCGAKYKLPETFTGSQAKCQKCGSVIDVGKQRAAAAGAPATAGAAQPAAAAAARPAAAAKPAVDRSREAPKPVERAAAATARSERPTRRSRDKTVAVVEGEGGGESPRGRRGAAKKNNTMPLVLSGVGLIAIIVVAVFMFGGDKKPKTDETAKVAAAPKAAEPAPTPADAAPAAEPPAATPAAKPPEPKAGEAKPATATPTDAAAPPPTADDPSRPKKPWEKMRNPPAGMDQVTDPKTYGAVKWPAAIDDAKKAEVRGLAEQAAGSGMPSVRAKTKLKELDFPSLFAIVEQLQKLDYKSPDDSGVAGDFNKLLEEITGGQNARFEFVDATEVIPPAKAEWNTRTVKGWMDMLAKIPDEGTFKKERADRLKKAADK